MAAAIRLTLNRQIHSNKLMFFGTHTPGGVVVLIDLGGAADFETGQGCSGDEAMFDPVYGAPEQFTRTKKAGIVGGFGGLFGGKETPRGWRPRQGLITCLQSSTCLSLISAVQITLL
jgi:hypothetical protein